MRKILMLKNKFSNLKVKIKDFIHQHENLDKLALLVWSSWWIGRAMFIFKRIKKDASKQFTSNGSKNGKVLILGIRTIPTTALVYFDAIFGHAFRKLGCDVKMLYCDGVLDCCDANSVVRSQRPQCFACKKLGPLVKNSLGLNCISFRQYISKEEIRKIEETVNKLEPKELIDYQYFGVNVGVYAKASAVRFFLSGEQLDLNNPEQLAILRRKLVYSMITAKVAKEVYLKEKPFRAFTLHGIYSTWGPFYEYFRNQNINVIVYCNVAARFGNFIFNLNRRDFNLPSPNSWNEFKKTPLSKEEEVQIDAYLSLRFKAAVGEILLFKKSFDKTAKESLLKFLANKKYLRRYVLFANLSWDSAVEGDSAGVFKNMFVWIDTIIDYFKKNPDYQLIIKPHPAELVWEKKSKRLKDYIAIHHSSLPENIEILEADTLLKAYDLVSSETVYLVYSGTLGLELATQGVPVLTAASSHYDEAGITYPVKTKEKFFSLLDNPQSLIFFAKNNVKMSKKYAYYYFLKAPIRLPFYYDDRYSVMNWKPLLEPEKLLDKNSNIIKICKKIISGEDAVAPL